MFKHYLTTALRHFRQHKLTTSINVMCLALGLICFILAWAIAAFFDQSDRYHARAERTFFITNSSAPTSKIFFPTSSSGPWVLAENLKADIPQLETVARSFNGGEMPISVKDVTRFGSVAFADPEFTHVFDLPFLRGDDVTALNAPHSAIVSSAFAQRMFGNDNVVGKTLRVANREDVTITAVISSIRQPSHMSTESSQAALHMDVLLSMDTHVALAHAMNPAGANLEFTDWGYSSFLTYVVLPEDGSFDAQQLDARLASFSKQRVPAASGERLFRARPMSSYTEIGLNTLVGTDITGISSMLILKMLGGLVLLVACLNYANLATAQAATRGKEVALQKIVGASAQQIMMQYLFQASLLVAVAMLLAIAGLALISVFGHFALLTGLRTIVGHSVQFWLFIALLLFAVSALAGAYPAFALSRVRPINALRSSRTNRGSRLASALVGLQFGATSFLMITVLVMSAQNDSLRNSVFSAASDPVLIIANDTTGISINRHLLKSELLQIPGVVAVSSVQYMPWTANMNAPGVLSTSRDASITTSVRVQRHTIDKDFFSTLDIPVLAGRVFEGEKRNDATTDIVIDRALARSLGFAKPQDAIGKIIYSQRSFDASIPPEQFAVIGVVEDKVLKPLSFGFAACFYVFDPNAATIPVVRVSKNNLTAALNGVDAAWHRLVPNEPIRRRFADEQFEQAFFFLGILSGTFGVLAGFASGIAIMGLIGMALHIIQQRTHEIGVRKTLGASVSQIVLLLLRSFSKPVVIANLVAWPLAYLTMTMYLSIFARSNGMSPLPFIASLVGTLGIAWLAVVVQATRAARMNPATVLRYE